MSIYSSNQIKSLGKRLRDGSRLPNDIEMIETFRAEYDLLLLESAFIIDDLLSKTGIVFLISGRAKRTKSIIRKIQRPKNYGMDLSRMSDLVGLRIIVETIKQQDKALTLLNSKLPIKKMYDYRSDKEYRSIHIISYNGAQLIEIQLRTIIQHLWADESEKFGEIVKEGGGSIPERNYLCDLSNACKMLEEGKLVSEINFPSTLMKTEIPINVKLNTLNNSFNKAVKNYQPHKVGNSHIIIFDNYTNELLNEYSFGRDDREKAIKQYQSICKDIDDTRFDVIILNSLSRTVLSVTHSRFFPETK